MSLPAEFRSDNAAPAHPAVLDAMAAANAGSAGAYGNDPWTKRADAWFKDQFGGQVESYLVWNGTGANVSALRAMTRPWEAVICSDQAHIHVDECGAPELLSGCKLLDLPSADAKLTVEQVRAAALKGVGFEHHIQPRVLSLTQTTEYGTAYSVDELGALVAEAHGRGLLVHVDGARIANAAASLGVTLREMITDTGVDALSFGLTKNGAIGAEAVVLLNPALVPQFKYIRKQSTQLASKMRFLAAQVVALADHDLWLDNARQANAMAQRLAAGLTAAGVNVTQRVQANAAFAIMESAMIARLQEQFHFYEWDETRHEVRLMCSWATEAADVDAFVGAVSR